jgi:two-component system sensor histidine kinase UhpB
VASVRRIASDLRPVMLDDLGLVPAIEGLLHALSESTGIVISLEADADSLDYGEPLATSIYRMVQEALTNVRRHAEAHEVRVTLAIEGDHIVVRVRDDGKGFDAEAAARRKSYGIIGIRERAQMLGGQSSVTRLARGTLVEIRIPASRYRKRGEARDTGTAG